MGWKYKEGKKELRGEEKNNMNNQIEKTPLEEAFEGIISDKEQLRKVALKCWERGYINSTDYLKFCEANKLLIF